MRHRVNLNPDGTNPVGLAVIVSAATGVTYGSQCGGASNDHREAEGFLVLCSSRAYDLPHDVEAELQQWFAARGSQGRVADTWPPRFVDELADVVMGVEFWCTGSSGEDSRSRLSLDRSRSSECTEAWIPVITPVGRGILVFDNSD